MESPEYLTTSYRKLLSVKQVKRQQQQQVMKSIGFSYGHQQYGNADSVMQQLRNQNQTTIDQINSMVSALKSLQNFKPFHQHQQNDECYS